jgi:uncharacterized protein YcbK (DUF882 family)
MSSLPSGRLSPHFTREEFACNHCGQLPCDPPQNLLDLLESVRTHFNAPTVVLSGYRCETHNTNVGGAPKTKKSKGSQHMQVTAADIAVKDVHPHVVHEYLAKLLKGKGGLGKYSTFTHVDVRSTPARW